MNKRVTTIAYMAGMVDGEGCITLHKNGKYFSVRLTVTNTDFNIITWCKENFDGCYYINHRKRKDIHKPAYHWSVENRMAEKVLKLIYPYLIIKKSQAKIALKFRKLVNNRKKGQNPFSIEEVNERKALFFEMKKLNKRGLA